MPDLFERITQKSGDELTRRVSNVEDLEIDHLEKRDTYKVGKNLKRIKVAASWAAAITLLIMTLVFITAFTYLFYLYITDIAKTPAGSKDLLKNWLDYVLLVMATLFVQRVFSK